MNQDGHQKIALYKMQFSGWQKYVDNRSIATLSEKNSKVDCCTIEVEDMSTIITFASLHDAVIWIAFLPIKYQAFKID